MKFSCSRSELINAISICQKAVSNRTTMPILEGIFFEATCGKLILSATNMEISIRTEIPAEIESDGEIVLKSTLISEVIRKLSGETVYFDKNDHQQIKIECVLSSFTIKGQGAEEFPDFPEINEDYSFRIATTVLREMVKGVLFSIATNENVPILLGMKMEISGSAIDCIALDGYRLAMKSGQTLTPIENPISVIIPGRSMQELLKLLSEEAEEVVVRFSNSQILFTIDGTELTTRLLEGEFINYKNIIPSDINNRIKIDRRLFLESSERAALLAREGKNNLIKLDFNEDQLQLTSAADVGSVFEIIAIENSGEPMRIAFNSKYLIDVLKVIDEDTIYVELTTPSGPALIKAAKPEKDNTDTSDKSFLYLILPVRI